MYYGIQKHVVVLQGRNESNETDILKCDFMLLKIRLSKCCSRWTFFLLYMAVELKGERRAEEGRGEERREQRDPMGHD